eukprot:351270-Chlamydomonas_euryale.AAC.10
MQNYLTGMCMQRLHSLAHQSRRQSCCVRQMGLACGSSERAGKPASWSYTHNSMSLNPRPLPHSLCNESGPDVGDFQHRVISCRSTWPRWCHQIL